MEKLNVLLISAIIILLLVSGLRLYFGSNAIIVNQVQQTLQTSVSSVLVDATYQQSGVQTFQQSNAPISKEIQNSEYLNIGGPTISNFWYNEKFKPGTVEISQTTKNLQCYAANYITPPHFIWTHVCYHTIFGEICIPVISVGGAATSYTDYSSLTGYMGFPQPAGSAGVFLQNEFNCNPSGVPLQGYDFPELASAQLISIGIISGVSNPFYCLPSWDSTNPIKVYDSVSGKTYGFANAQTSYANFINWSANDIHNYTGISTNGQNYFYAINTNFNVPAISTAPGPSSTVPAVPDGSTLIIPSLSCGATFPNNYINFEFPGGEGIPEIASLSGFTPSVGLATQQNSVGVTYLFGGVLWPGFSNALFTYANDNLADAFDYNLPTLNYAQFPAGNKGDAQYLNVSSFFETLINSTYFGGGNKSLVSVYQSNLTFATIVGLHDFTSTSWSQLLQDEQFDLTGVGGWFSTSSPVSINAYSLPNLQAAYYPMLTSGIQSDFNTYDYFRTDGVFPFCGWDSSAGTLGAIDTNCTFENPSTVNPISYERFTSSGNVNNLAVQPYEPGYYSGDILNSFTTQELNSYCFYGENFSTITGVYTPPSYTRIIPPIAAENYTTAIGECNGFFNNTNCFSSSYSSNINFNDGIFSSGITCTPKGVVANNVTDAWISSLYVANNAGDFCGDFLGQKNLINPTANSTMFLEGISTGCPAFNSNDSQVSLVITVKNVGNTNITDPYLLATFGNPNISNMFYSSKNTNTENYNLYTEFLQNAQTETTGVFEIRYNSALNTDMYYYKPGYPLNPVPIAQLFARTDYQNGPYNNSLLGMWIYSPSLSGRNVVRTANTFLVHSSSNDSGIPKIIPNGTATFTIEVPMGVFEQLLSGKYNVSVYFGNSFNVSWAGNSGSPPNIGLPSEVVMTSQLSSGYTVDPLVASGIQNNNLTHNNELLVPGDSEYVSPPWQYLVGYSFNMSKNPFGGVKIYSENLNFSISAPQSTQSVLNVSLSPSVTVENGTQNQKTGTHSFDLTPADLTGSSVSCFASQENVNDFSVFWSVQDVSPPNLQYAIQNFYTKNDAVDNVLVKSWTGLVFMPYSDVAVLNYDNLPLYSISSVSMQLQQPSLNQSVASQYSKEAFVYFGSGAEAPLFGNLSSTYSLLSISPVLTPVAVPSALYGFTLTVNNLLGSRSTIRIIGSDLVQNYSQFTGKNVQLTFYYNGAAVCSISGTSTVQQILSIPGSNSCLAQVLTEPSYTSHTTLLVKSSYGPFYSEMYNTSSLNLSNTQQGGTVLVASNITSTSPSGGTFKESLNISQPINNGFTLLFGLSPQSKLLKNSNVYLYYTNNTPFNCNIVNNIGSMVNNGVTKINAGEYYNAPNGTVLCNLTGTISGLRAVFMNASNGKYLGSGDFGLGVAVQNISGKSLLITDNGVPVNSQSVNLSSISIGGGTVTYNCFLCNQVIYNGILNYSGESSKVFVGGNYSINFTETDQGVVVFKTIAIPSIKSTAIGGFLITSPSSSPDNPSSAYNLTFASSSASASIPVSFSLPNSGGCDNIKLLSDYPYPYAEYPYQVISTAGVCTYEVMLNKNSLANNKNYMIFDGVTQPALSYSDNWLNTSFTPYNVFITTSAYTTNLLGNCQSSTGPCLGTFSLQGSGVIGSLLINNVSSGQATISQTADGPLMKCFEVAYTASQQVVWKETGFGGISYTSNQLYQVTNPSQQVSSTYCFFNGVPIVTDTISSQGSALSFSIVDNLNSNFSFAENDKGKTLYVPPPIFVGYNGSYSKLYISELTIKSELVPDPFNLLYSCTTGASIPTTTLPSLPIPSSFIKNQNKFYCIFGGEPTYSPQGSGSDNAYETASGENISLAYLPGVYNLSVFNGTVFKNGQKAYVNSTIYGDCALTKNITSTSSVQTLSSNEILYIRSPPELTVNSSTVNYDPTNPGERFLANYTAPIGGVGFNGAGILYSSLGSSGSVGPSMIASCPAGQLIKNYTVCTSTVLDSNAVNPMNGSYDAIEALPNLMIGNYNRTYNSILGANVYGPNNYIGGGCFVGTDSANGKTYSCAPTNGSLSLVLKSPTYIKSSTSNVAYSLPVFANSTVAPITATKSFFTCSGWVYAESVLGGSPTNYTVYCGNGSTGPNCASTAGVGYSSSNSANVIAACIAISPSPFILSQSISINVKSISARQSEKTMQFGNLTCGNVTNVISQNVKSGIASWKPFATKVTFLNGTTYALADVGGCEEGRDVYNISAPNITTAYTTVTLPNGQNVNEPYGKYSCPSGYSGSIEACANVSATSFSGNVNPSPSCTNSEYPQFYTTSISVPAGAGYGEIPLGCKKFSKQGYLLPTVANGCMADHVGASSETNSSYVLQYSNGTTSIAPLGIGLGVLNMSVPTNISIPQSGEHDVIKDQYMSGLSVSQYEGRNIVTDEYPTSLLLSSQTAQALFKSSLYPYDLLNVLTLQNPYFKIYGMPGFINGSEFDYALSLFTGGTSSNCIGGSGSGDYALFSLGEGQLCSGQNAPTAYPNGVYLSLGMLNEGVHGLQFYSVSETGNTSSPNVNIYDSVGSAYSLNTACANGNARVYTSTYNGGSWRLNISADEECNAINNKLYGYIVNCMYQTPSNTTFTVASNYYLAYNLPTLWKVSYTLLVSPKTYNMVPTPIYEVNSSYGSYLSLYPHYTTKFVEKGLPTGRLWSVTYDSQTASTASTTAAVTTKGGRYPFIVSTPTNKSSTLDCTTYYVPSPASGSAAAGSVVNINFTGSTSCTTIFDEKNLLPNRISWSVTYDNIVGSGATGSNISITLPASKAGTYTYSATALNGIKCTASGSALAGSVVYINSWSCVNTFTESGLPNIFTWSVTYNGNKNSTAVPNKITFSSTLTSQPPGRTYSVDILTNSSTTACTTTWTPKPQAGTAAMGNTTAIVFKGSTSCVTTFLLPSALSTANYVWWVDYNGNNKTASTSSNIVFSNVPSGSHSYTSGIDNLKCPTGTQSAAAGTTVNPPWSCTTTFNSGISPSVYTNGGWGVLIGTNPTEHAAGFSSSITITSPPQSSTSYTAGMQDYSCAVSSSFIAGGTYTPPWAGNCYTTFIVTPTNVTYIGKSYPLTFTMTYDGSTPQTGGPNPGGDLILLLYTTGAGDYSFSASGFSPSGAHCVWEPIPSSGTMVVAGNNSVPITYSDDYPTACTTEFIAATIYPKWWIVNFDGINSSNTTGGTDIFIQTPGSDANQFPYKVYWGDGSIPLLCQFSGKTYAGSNDTSIGCSYVL